MGRKVKDFHEGERRGYVEGFLEGDTKDLGTYTARSEHYEARMHVAVKVLGPGITSDHLGSDHYAIDVSFCNDGGHEYLDRGEHVANIRVGIDTVNFPSAFARLKKCEEGIEEALDDTRHRHMDWRGRREIMQCILELERKTASVVPARERERDKARALLKP